MPSSYAIKITVALTISALFIAVAGLMPLVNAVVFCGFAATVYFYFACSGRLVHNSLWAVMLVAGVFGATYRPAGFHYPLIIDEPFLHPGGPPFQLYINLSKALAGWMLVVFFWECLNEKPLVRGGKSALVVMGCILLILGMAWWLLNLKWVLKLPSATVYFIVVNVLVTCVAEEAFFRLLLQKHLMKWFANGYLRLVVPAVFTGVLFALVHQIDLSSTIFVVYLLAGIGYASVYALTGRFTFAVMAHAGVNIGHFLLLPYPLPA